MTASTNRSIARSLRWHAAAAACGHGVDLGARRCAPDAADSRSRHPAAPQGPLHEVPRSDQAQGKLNLTGPRSLARGGESGPAVVPGSSTRARSGTRSPSDEMPPKPEEPLSADEKALLRRWIEQGAKRLAQRLRDFQKPRLAPTTGRSRRPAVPSLPRCGDAARVRTAVDRFIVSGARGAGTGPQPRGRPRDLDPPPQLRPDRPAAGPRRSRRSLADHRPDAYERLVDRLLASPHYGERWGKYWLDASGYADSNGYFSADSDRPLAYRYRDYVIRAFNADRPLDQIVREQLAGDELAGYRPGIDGHARDRRPARRDPFPPQRPGRHRRERRQPRRGPRRQDTPCSRERFRSSARRSWG